MARKKRISTKQKSAQKKLFAKARSIRQGTKMKWQTAMKRAKSKR